MLGRAGREVARVLPDGRPRGRAVPGALAPAHDAQPIRVVEAHGDHGRLDGVRAAPSSAPAVGRGRESLPDRV